MWYLIVIPLKRPVVRVKKEDQDSSPTSKSPSPLTRSSSSSDLGHSVSRPKKEEKQKPERKSHLNRLQDKTTTYRYDLERQKTKEPPSKKLLEKVTEILKSCDEINKDAKSVESERGEAKADVSTKKEKRTVSIITKSPAKESRARSASPRSPRLRGRPRSFSRSRSPPRRRGSPRYSPMRFRRPFSRSRSRSRSPPPRYRPLWIAVSPLSLLSDVRLEKASKCRVLLSLRGRVLHSHWSRSNEALLSLVGSCS